MQDELRTQAEAQAAAAEAASRKLQEAQQELDRQKSALALKERDCHSIEGRFRAAQIDLKMLQVIPAILQHQ